MGFFDDIGKGFKDLGKGIKKAAEWVGDKADDVAEGVGKAAGTVAKGIGLGKFAPAIERGVKGIINVATPVGVVGSMDDIVDKGLIDGMITSKIDAGQDMGAGIVGAGSAAVGKDSIKTMGKFDKVVDEKIQPIAETVAGTVVRVGLACVPGGAAVLAVDTASQAASLGIKAANGEKVGVMDAVGVAASAIPGIGAAAKGAVGIGKGVTKGALSASDDVAKGAAKGVASSADDVAKGAAKGVASSADDAAKGAAKGVASSADDVTSGATKTTKNAADDAASAPAPKTSDIVKEGATDGVVDYASGEVMTKVNERLAEKKPNSTHEELAQGFDTTVTSSDIPGGQATPLAGSSSGSTFSLPS